MSQPYSAPKKRTVAACCRVADLGGVHTTAQGTVTLDDLAEPLGLGGVDQLIEGRMYEVQCSTAPPGQLSCLPSFLPPHSLTVAPPIVASDRRHFSMCVTRNSNSRYQPRCFV